MYYYNAVYWARDNGITTGRTPTAFEPNGACTRGQIVTFLWRFAGEPNPTSLKNPFRDVKSTDYYYKAVLWALEKGITTGKTATTFLPNAACTREQCVTFLWRVGRALSGEQQQPVHGCQARRLLLQCRTVGLSSRYYDGPYGYSVRRGAGVHPRPDRHLPLPVREVAFWFYQTQVHLQIRGVTFWIYYRTVDLQLT